MGRPIKVIINTPAGLEHEILTGAIGQDSGISVVEPSTGPGAADVLVVADVPAARERDVLAKKGKVLVIDSHDHRVDLYEIRPLGQAHRASDLTTVIRALTRRSPSRLVDACVRLARISRHRLWPRR